MAAADDWQCTCRLRICPGRLENHVDWANEWAMVCLDRVYLKGAYGDCIASMQNVHNRAVVFVAISMSG